MAHWHRIVSTVGGTCFHLGRRRICPPAEDSAALGSRPSAGWLSTSASSPPYKIHRVLVGEVAWLLQAHPRYWVSGEIYFSLRRGPARAETTRSEQRCLAKGALGTRSVRGVTISWGSPPSPSFASSYKREIFQKAFEKNRFPLLPAFEASRHLACSGEAHLPKTTLAQIAHPDLIHQS